MVLARNGLTMSNSASIVSIDEYLTALHHTAYVFSIMGVTKKLNQRQYD